MKDITSTERLLDVIRNKKDDIDIKSIDTSKIDPLKKRFKFNSLKISPLQKSVNVGIDIGHKYLRLVKIAKLADKNWEMLAYKSIPFTHDKKSSEFTNFLKSEINGFCGVYKNVNLWAIMSAARVNVRHIHIPKVAKKRIENAVYWTIKKETPFDEKDTIFDFEIQGEVVEQGVSKWLTMVYTAPKEEVDELKGLFSQIGLPLTGISITPFAIQNIFKAGWMPSAVEGTIAGLFIGNDFSRIDIYAGGKLIMTRGIKAGINSMVETVMERLQDTGYVKSEIEGKRSPVNVEQARKVLFSIGPSSPPLTEQDVGFELKDEEKFEIILPAIERIVRQAERTFEHFRVNLNYERVDKIYISSAMDISKRIIEYIGDQLAIKSDLPDPLILKLPFTVKSMEQLSASERIALTPALGLALSDNAYTPNLMFRFKDKERAANIGRANRIIVTVFIIVTFLSSGFYIYQTREAREKEAQIAGLERQLSQNVPRIDQSLISQIAADAAKREQVYKEYSDKYLGMAVISELSLLTPANIRLVNLRAHVGTVPSGKGSVKELKKETAKEELKHVVLEGVVLGDRKTLESSLAGYVMKLEASPIFRQVSVQKNNIEPFKKTEILYFVIDMQIG
ncbi:MAG TPA: pilus assembly protein PilM [Syntrophales bacterium]|nr:pilus assembly protein PilM [Syntrophales bacterium]